MYMKTEAIEHYPFRAEENEYLVRQAIFHQANLLFSDPVFEGISGDELFSSFYEYFNRADELFLTEEKAREERKPGANLYYHGRDHATRQATFDSLIIDQRILERGDLFARHLTANGAFAIPLGAMYHDNGYVSQSASTDNFAARTPIHVLESMRVLGEELEVRGLPQGLNPQRVRDLALLGVYQTTFPFSDRDKDHVREALAYMSPKERKEAHIVRLAVQYADLGGQVARVDYYPDLLRALRAEMNEANPGLGNSIIGEDEELLKKCAGFMNGIVKSTVGKTGNAFFGPSHPFAEAWKNIGLE